MATRPGRTRTPLTLLTEAQASPPTRALVIPTASPIIMAPWSEVRDRAGGRLYACQETRE